ncbi:MAG TPA: hypothetical protein ACQGQH_06310 [Xylella sp.]
MEKIEINKSSQVRVTGFIDQLYGSDVDASISATMVSMFPSLRLGISSPMMTGFTYHADGSLKKKDTPDESVGRK